VIKYICSEFKKRFTQKKPFISAIPRSRPADKKAKVPPKADAGPKRTVPDMKKCGQQNCGVYPYIQPGKYFKATATNYRVDFNAQVDCNSSNVCYALNCMVANCGKQYIGQTRKSLRERLKQHLSYVDCNNKATGRHFNLPRHSKSDLTAVIEKFIVHSREVWCREEIKSMHIRKAHSFNEGINLKP
jgi:hypothetical protein